VTTVDELDSLDVLDSVEEVDFEDDDEEVDGSVEDVAWLDVELVAFDVDVEEDADDSIASGGGGGGRCIMPPSFPPASPPSYAPSSSMPSTPRQAISALVKASGIARATKSRLIACLPG
jgi:hypothetical protein